MARSKKETAKEKETDIFTQREVFLSRVEGELLFELAGDILDQHIVIEIANKAYEPAEGLARGVHPIGTRAVNTALSSSNRPYDKSTREDSADGVVNRIKAENASGVTLLHGSAYDLSLHWKEPIGLLVMIGYQYYEDVREAIACWQMYLAPNAIVVIHDCHEPGPAKVIKEFSTDGGNLIIRQIVENMTVLGIDTCQHHWTINSREIGICRKCGRKRDYRRLAREATNIKIKKRINQRMTRSKIRL